MPPLNVAVGLGPMFVGATFGAAGGTLVAGAGPADAVGVAGNRTRCPIAGTAINITEIHITSANAPQSFTVFTTNPSDEEFRESSRKVFGGEFNIKESHMGQGRFVSPMPRPFWRAVRLHLAQAGFRADPERPIERLWPDHGSRGGLPVCGLCCNLEGMESSVNKDNSVFRGVLVVSYFPSTTYINGGVAQLV